MKVVGFKEYGPPEVLRIAEVLEPTAGPDHVLIRVHAGSINAQDYRTRSGRPFLLRFLLGGVRRPKNRRIGSDLAGTVVAVGENVKQFRPGDEVFGCRGGAFAEYLRAFESVLALKPANVSFEQAAAVPVAALTALQAIRHGGGIEPGQQVLIQGASGGVGTFAVQLAKSFGAEVTAVCSTRNLELARSIGADHVIDYARLDFTRQPQRYDLIVAVNGYHPLLAYRRALSRNGRYVCAGGALLQFVQAMALGSLLSRANGKRMFSMGIADVKQEDLVFLAELLELGKITPVIDRSYPLSEIVEAFRYVEDTHAQGKVVITLERRDPADPSRRS